MIRTPQHQTENIIPIPHDNVLKDPLHIINQEETNIRDEDNQFVNSNKNKRNEHSISIRIDRRISMGSDEMREIIEHTEEIEVNRPIYEPISNQPNFYESSILSSNIIIYNLLLQIIHS